MLLISTPSTPEQLDAVRTLMRAFLLWHRERHARDAELIDGYFDSAAFERELASLPGKYAPPGGALLLATFDGVPAGCVALRQIDGSTCEMKRMFVHSHLHGKGIGRALARAVIEHARGLGYTLMRLDTSVGQAEAQALYRSLGFRDIDAYYDLPEPVRNWLVFMELDLTQTHAPTQAAQVQ